jgi:Icc protein
MSTALQLIHLTDFHLLAEPAARLHGWHVEQAFCQVLEDARRRWPQAAAYVLGGDLVDDESRLGYARLDTHLARLDRPVLAMAGNHDDPAAMADALAHARVHEPLHLGGWQLIALDSHMKGSEAGRIGPAQLQRLDRALADCGRPTLLFVHHPPVAVGSAWIDAIGLTDRDALETIVARHPHVRAVVCGHAHQAFEGILADRPCLITPATMRQFAPGAHEFAEDADRAPGYRWLTLAADGQLDTGVCRVPDALKFCG